MQKSAKKAILIFVSTLVVSIILTALRTALMLFGFDFESKFFSNNILATGLYVFLMICALVIWILSKKIKITANENNVCRLLNIFAMIVFAFIFVSGLFAVPTELVLIKVVNGISLVTAFLSMLYYLFDSFLSKKLDLVFLRILGIAPVIYLLSETIGIFVKASGRANSYYLFPNIISLLVMAYFILNDGQSKIVEKNEKALTMLSPSLITIVFLAFSAIPDIILIVTQKMSFETSYILHTVLKCIFIALALVATIDTIKRDEEDNV